MRRNVQFKVGPVDGTLARANWPKVKKMSMPVSYTVVGCVQGGEFWSRQYSYQVLSDVDGEWQAASLDAYEGKTIEIDGALSPGDKLYVSTVTIIDDECQPDLHSSKSDLGSGLTV